MLRKMHTMTSAPSPFAQLGLSPALARVALELGYEAPTPIQIEAIPIVLQGADVWASAETGSGKTAAFVLPMADRLLSRAASPDVSALILVPTHELALQTADFIDRCAPELKACLVVGGVSENPQMMALRGGADVVIATPGRLLDLIRKNALTLRSLEVLVLDEADRLLSLGFGAELEEVRAQLPTERQTLLFSATFPQKVKALAETFLRKPVRIDVSHVAVPLLEQRAIETDLGKRTQLLAHLIREGSWSQVLVFVASRHTADHVSEKLRRAGLSAAALHGDLSQTARQQALADLKEHKVQVLVATDVAARGLDIVRLPLVVNYDLPRSPVDFVHRVGRTARAGEQGLAVSFLTAENDAHFRLIEKRSRIQVIRESVPGFERTHHEVPAGDPHGGIKGKRPNKKDKRRAAANKL